MLALPSPRLLAAFALSLLPGAALAQAPASKGSASALFKEGRALMEQKRYAEACPKLAESYKLEPAPGTLLNLGLCHEGEGKLATAWSELNAALAAAKRDGRDDRAKLAKQHLDAIEPKLPRLVIQVPAGSRIAGLEIKTDDVLVAEPTWGSAIPVDPGPHQVEASAPGHRGWSTRIEVTEPGPSTTLTVPRLDPEQSEAPAPAASSSSAPAPPPPPPPPPSVGRRAGGYALLGLGAVGLGVGAFFGIRAIGQRRDADDRCPSERCTREGYDLNQSAKTSADVSTVAFAIGAVAAGAGVYLLLSSSSPRSAPASALRGLTLSPALGGGTTGATLSAHF